MRALLTDGPLLIPGCHDPFSARLAADAGAGAVFASGGAIGRALFGTPSIPAEQATRYFAYLRVLCEYSTLPVIADGEVGFGDPLATCHESSAVGAAGVIIGDSTSSGDLRPPEEVEALIEQARTTDLVLVPRADGLAEGVVETCVRLRRYRAAGAELVLPLLTSLPERSVDRKAMELLAGASGGRLAIHCAQGNELESLTPLPPAVRAVIVTALSVPTYGGQLVDLVHGFVGNAGR